MYACNLWNIKFESKWTQESFSRLLEEFYQVVFRSKIYQSVDELDTNLVRFIEFYNCQRTHHGKRTQGRVPAWLYLLDYAA